MTQEDGNAVGQTRCPRCGADNRCGMQGDTPCWCAGPSLRRLAPDPSVSACYCKTCLEQLLAEQAQRAI